MIGKLFTPHPYRTKFLWVIGFLVLLILVGLAFYYTRTPWSEKHQTSTGDQTNNSSGKSTDTQNIDIPRTSLPKNLPTNINLEPDAKVTQNYETRSAKGEVVQSTRVYESAKTPDQNKDAYLKYFAANGWNVVASHEEQDIKVYTATKDQFQIQLSITWNALKQYVRVEQTVTLAPNLSS